ncbi:EAL domain-containing protein [Mesorhizobium sp. CAU 1741]|uniref:EAL domain-containing protein n=1 Tax=Mesorhizobium sp. CAU 1741 TaxID=3140366 RepID=UPI00325B1576
MMTSIDLAISADEIGIRSARHGEMLLRSAFQLIYRTSDDTFEGIAAEGFVRIFRSGQTVEPLSYLDHLPAQDHVFATRLATALHIANHGNIGIDGLDHILAIRSPVGLISPEAVSHLLTETGMDASRLICLVRDAVSLQSHEIRTIADEFRSLGARIAMASSGQPDLQAIRSGRPDIVSIDGAWFRRVCLNVSAMRLLCSFVGGLRADGITVLIDGIETRSQLRAAVDTGADLLRGYLFGRPQLAGTVPPDAVLDRAKLLSGGGGVVSLFDAGVRRTHQAG